MTVSFRARCVLLTLAAKLGSFWAESLDPLMKSLMLTSSSFPKAEGAHLPGEA